MNWINYDPSVTAQINYEFYRRARQEGMFPIHVLCIEEGSEEGSEECVDFYAFGDCVPRIGESIMLDDDKLCRVCDVRYKLSKVDDGTPLMVANVLAKSE